MTVYFARSVESGQIKIGFVNDDSEQQPSLAVMRRLRQIGAVFGVTMKLLATAPGRRVEERAYHQRFAADAAGYEWFRPSPVLIAEIAEGPSIPPSPDRPVAQEPPALNAEEAARCARFFSALLHAAVLGNRLVEEGRLGPDSVYAWSARVLASANRWALGDGVLTDPAKAGR